MKTKAPSSCMKMAKRFALPKLAPTVALTVALAALIMPRGGAAFTLGRMLPASRRAAPGRLALQMAHPHEDAPMASRRAAIAGVVVAPIALGVPAPAPAAGTGSIKLGKGSKGLAVPEMGVGAWSWGDEGVWKYGTAGGASEESIAAAYRACLSNGITFVDTAEIYGDGLSETILGKLLAETPPAQRRYGSALRVCTCACVSHAPPSPPPLPPARCR